MNTIDEPEEELQEEEVKDLEDLAFPEEVEELDDELLEAEDDLLLKDPILEVEEEVVEVGEEEEDEEYLDFDLFDDIDE